MYRYALIASLTLLFCFFLIDLVWSWIQNPISEIKAIEKLHYELAANNISKLNYYEKDNLLEVMLRQEGSTPFWIVLPSLSPSLLETFQQPDPFAFSILSSQKARGHLIAYWGGLKAVIWILASLCFALNTPKLVITNTEGTERDGHLDEAEDLSGFFETLQQPVVRAEIPKVGFKDVIGLDEASEEAKQLVDFLKNPDKFHELGATLPKGFLLDGPPGTGKTLMAKAIAGEAGVPFFEVPASSFVEVYVGIGARRVRELFAEAAACAPCIVFIDELDAIGANRTRGMDNGDGERTNTLNQLLTEMDGFTTRTGVIVLAATNHSQVLDPALCRAGRFDKHIGFTLPSQKARKAILAYYLNKATASPDIDLDWLAARTVGFSGADLKNVVNEAALQAGRHHETYIQQADLLLAENKVRHSGSVPKPSLVRRLQEKRLGSYAIAAEAVLRQALQGSTVDIRKVSIVPTTNSSLGQGVDATMEEFVSTSKARIQENLVLNHVGAAAVEYFLGKDDISYAVSHQRHQATEYLYHIIAQYGFELDLGALSFDRGSQPEFIKEMIDTAVLKWNERAAMEARSLVHQHADVIKRVQKALFDKEELTVEEFEQLIKNPS